MVRDTTSSEKRKSQIDGELSKMKENKTVKKETNKTLAKKPKTNSGFVNMLTVIAISAFASGFVIGVVFMIFNYLS